MIGTLARRMFARRGVLLYSRALDATETLQAPAGCVFTDLSLSDLTFCAMAQQRGRMERFRRRLDEGYRCAGFRDSNGEVVSYIWFARGGHGPSTVAVWRDVRVWLAPGEVFFWDCRTAPEHEGRGLYRTALRLAGARLAAEGNTRAWIETTPDNLASQRGITGAGFVLTADFSIIDVAGIRWLRSGRSWRRLPAPLRLDEMAFRRPI